jgi:hypothetical protein
MTKTRLLTYGAALALSLGATSANAVEAFCPFGGAGAGVRLFTVDTTPVASCWDYDVGNTNLPIDEIPLPGPGTPYDLKLQMPTGYVLLDKSDETNNLYEGLLSGTPVGLESGLSGTFQINLPSLDQYIIIFKTGTAILNPDWAAFLLPQGVLSGSWSISGAQELSHVELWGKNVVPLPAAAWLLGSGLLGLFAVGRRRKSAQVAAA